ncbi:hypothetical protein [Pseudocnuella soli]|uniref:hypothetical protein n=1 Tax=Pseudocnuella soli TaxID=2502779 RepID=UPI001047E927|nr:hypothetical protein [Pseudocnuella soli]
MKLIFSKLTVAVFAFVLLFASCSKVEDLPKPVPGKGDTPAPATAQFRFAAQINLTGQPYHPSSLHAVVTVVNEKGEAVLTDKQLTIEIGEQVITQNLTLPVGQYKLTSFRLEHGNTYTRFAAPMAGSAKAQGVQHPLAISFGVKQTETTVVPVEVLKVAEGEKPAQFGYPAGAFDHNQSNTDPFATIKARVQIKVGDLVYENTTGSVAITTYTSNGAQTTTYASLKAGINDIKLLKAATRFTLTVTKWGTRSELSLTAADLELDTIYTFSTEKSAKLLKSETTLKMVNNQYVPDHKKVYLYGNGSKLTEVQYAFRQQDGSILRGITERLAYSGSNVASVKRFDEKGVQTWATSFSYDAANRVTGIDHQQGAERVTGAVTYLGTPATGMGITYTYTKPGYHYQIFHNRNFRLGNVQDYNITRTNFQEENGMSDYDDGINPYRFLNLPDLYLSNMNQNNVVNEYKYFHAGYPDATPYKSEYKYDADGYPTEVTRHYRSFKGGVSKHAYTTKTTFEYQ